MLTKAASQMRQDRFRSQLSIQGIDAAVITDRREIYYLTGILLCDYPNFPFPAMLYVENQWEVVVGRTYQMKGTARLMSALPIRPMCCIR